MVNDAGQTAAFVLQPGTDDVKMGVKFQHKEHEGLVKLVQYARSVPFVCNHKDHAVKLASAAHGGTIIDPTELTVLHGKATQRKSSVAMVSDVARAYLPKPALEILLCKGV